MTRVVRRLMMAAVAAVLWSGAAAGASLDGLVRDAAGKPVADAVVFAVPVSPTRPAARGGRAVIDQQDKEFVPHVRAVLAGTEVTFPNKDDIRHHVYSFSAPKKFELPLYQGTQAPPVTFDTPGVVVLGCNIHDWMLGYVYVLDTPHFETTGADGRARIADLPAGAYDVHVWHPRLPERGAPAAQRVTVSDKDAPVTFVVPLKPDVRPRRAPSGAGGRYR
jgi:plastocyanin